MTCYNTMYGGPRQPGECDGPEEFHVVLLDNRRTELLADAEQRDALHCIRCGACLNVCPIFRNVGGHTYGTTYSGPIGSVITPHLRGLQDWKHLSNASSLCGACTEACPVKIDLHHHLLQNRRNASAKSRLSSSGWRIKFSASWRTSRRSGRSAKNRLAHAAAARAGQRLRARPGEGVDQNPRPAAAFRGNGNHSRTGGGNGNERTRKYSRPHPRGVKSPAPLPGSHGDARRSCRLPNRPPPAPREWLPAVGERLAEQFDLFAKNAAELKADFQLLASRDELRRARQIARRGKMAARRQPSGELSNFACRSLGLPVLLTDKGYDVHGWKNATRASPNATRSSRRPAAWW
jgi:ferredoxin